MRQYMVTTKDNPYNPFLQMDEWMEFDTEKGYNTLAYLDRLIVIPDDPTEKERTQAVNEAVDKMILNDIHDIYIRISEK